MKRSEEALHKACVAYLRASLPKPWLVWHTPNGGGRSKAEAGILKAMGVLAGMPDLFVMGPKMRGVVYLTATGGGISKAEPSPHLIAIEFKAPPKRLKSGALSKAKPALNPHQLARQADLGACGVPYLVIDDLTELHRALLALGVPLKGKVRA
jgi:hypothetical protein